MSVCLQNSGPTTNRPKQIFCPLVARSMGGVVTEAVFGNSDLVKNSNHKRVSGRGIFFDFSNPENLIICLLLQSKQTDPAHFWYANRARIARSNELLVESIGARVVELWPKNSKSWQHLKCQQFCLCTLLRKTGAMPAANYHMGQ